VEIYMSQFSMPHQVLLEGIYASVEKNSQSGWIPRVGVLVDVGNEGNLVADVGAGKTVDCLVLQMPGLDLRPGDAVLILPVIGGAGLHVVIGKIGRYVQLEYEKHVAIEAAESLTLKCGETSVELRADGKVLIKGEDVTVRAKGTQRIRASTVSIN
jgi:hypothetical protein